MTPEGFGAAPQVRPDHYASLRYDSKERFVSYWHQIEAVLRHGYETVLEVGPGNGFVTRYLRRHGVRVHTLDIDPALHPDLAASFVHVPLPAASVDAVLCCQVLEHVPFDVAEEGLREFRRVARLGAVISVMDITPYIKFEVAVPFIGQHRVFFANRFAPPPRHLHTPKEHYWEIGSIGYPVQRVVRAIGASGWLLSAERRLYENPFHRFFELSPA